jgi:hypothetical protein
LSRKAVHKWVEKFSQGRSKVADNARPGAEVAETTVTRLLCCGFRRTGKAMGQVYQCWWRISRNKYFFPGSNITYFTFYVHLCPIYWLSLVVPQHLHGEIEEKTTENLSQNNQCYCRGSNQAPHGTRVYSAIGTPAGSVIIRGYPRNLPAKASETKENGFIWPDFEINYSF